ncbi:MAG: hypothetical protein E7262_01845 [Lachnospiraceae bacterium]|nr:hypothetical protein [Lachnospiraceae bacterium]
MKDIWGKLKTKRIINNIMNKPYSIKNRIWASVVVLAIVASITLVNLKEIKIEEVEKVSDTATHDYTLQFNPETNQFINSGSGATISTSQLAAMGITYNEASGVDTITLNNVTFISSQSVAFEVLEASKRYDINIVAQGRNMIASSYDAGKTEYIAIRNDYGSIHFSGTGSLDVGCNNASELRTNNVYAIFAGDEVSFDGGTYNIKASGTSAAGVICKRINIIDGDIYVTAGNEGIACGMNASSEFNMSAGILRVDVNSRDGKAMGIGTSFNSGEDSMNITGGDIVIKINGQFNSLEELKKLIEYHEDKAEEAGTTVDELKEYISAAQTKKGATTYKDLVDLINASYDGGVGNFAAIKNAFIEIMSHVMGYGIASNKVLIDNAFVDIEINGINKTGIYASSTAGEDGLSILNNAKLSIYGDIDRTGINGSSAAAGGLTINNGQLNMEECEVKIELDNSQKASSSLSGIYVGGADVYFDTGANVTVEVNEGRGLSASGPEYINLRGGRVVLKGSVAAYNGNSDQIVYAAASGGKPATDIIAVANDIDGIERVIVDKTSNKWDYKYIDMGTLYNFSLYIDESGNVRRDNSVGPVLSSTDRENIGISVKTVATGLQINLENANFATSTNGAINVETNAIVNAKSGTINRISGTPTGSEANAIFNVSGNLTTQGTGTVVIDNRYADLTSKADNYKKGMIIDGEFISNGANLEVTGIDNCKNGIGMSISGKVTINSGSVMVKGGACVEKYFGIDNREAPFQLNGGDLTIISEQTSYNGATTSSSATAVASDYFTIKGGKADLLMHAHTGNVYGFYSYGSTISEYRQSGGVITISCTMDAEVDGYYTYSGGITNCYTNEISDGTLEITAYKPMETPIVDINKVTLSKALDEDGEEVASPTYEDIYKYRYILIEPIYHLLYQGSTGTLYRILEDSYDQVDEVGWYPQLGDDGLYDMVLNGFHFSTKSSGCILNGDESFDIILQEGSTNSLSYNHNIDSEGKTYTVGIYSSDGTVNITGTGELEMNGAAYSADPDNECSAMGIWADYLNIDGSNVNFNFTGPIVYGTYITEETTIQDADISAHIVRTKDSDEAQGLALISKDYDIDNSTITVTGGPKTLAIWSWDGTTNINSSILDVNIDFGGAIAGATTTNITNSKVNFVATDSIGGSYGIYTKEDIAQAINIENSDITMNVVGSRCMGIKASSNITLRDSNINMYFNVNVGVAGINTCAQDNAIVGNIDIDNCNITMDLFGTRTTGDNQGVVSTLGSVDVYGSYIKVNMDAGDGDGVHAGEYFSDNPSAYDDRDISLKINKSSLVLDINGKDLSEELTGVYSTMGDLDISATEIIFTNNRSSSTGYVGGVVATNNIAITNGSTILVAVEPESVEPKVVKGVDSQEGDVDISNASAISTHLTGFEVNGIFADKNMSASANSELNIDLYDVKALAVGIYGYAGEIQLNDIVNSTITAKCVKDSPEDDMAVGIAALDSDIYITDCIMDIDAYAETAYAVAAKTRVGMQGGPVTLKGSTSTVGTGTLSLTIGSESSIDSTATRVLEAHKQYKNSYEGDTGLEMYLNVALLEDYKYAKIATVPTNFFRYYEDLNKLCKVSYDGRVEIALTEDTWPEGLSIVDNKIVMNGFEYVTVAEKVLDIFGNGNIIVEGKNTLKTASGIADGSGGEFNGIYCSGALDIGGSATGYLTVDVDSISNARGIVAEQDLTISDINLEVKTTAYSSKGIQSVGGKVSMDLANVDIKTGNINRTMAADQTMYGIYAKTGLGVLNTKLKVLADTSVVYLEDITGSNIKGNVSASEEYDLTKVAAVTDINTSYISSASKYKALSVTPNMLSVTISWADLQYECEASGWNTTTGEYAESTWSTVNTDGDIISVKNDTATSPVYATFDYAPEVGYEDVKGSIKKAADYTEITGSKSYVSPLSTFQAKLVLEGQLSADAEDATLGNVTVKLSE